MRRLRPPSLRDLGSLALLAALAFGSAMPAHAAPTPQICDDVRPVPSGAADVRAAALSESLFMATRVPDMERVLGEALAGARARHDREATLWFLRRTAELRARHGRAAEAAVALRETETLALALGDSLTLASALRWQAAVRNQQGAFADSRRLGERLRALVARTGDRVHGAWAEAILGWADIQDGDSRSAIAHYRRAAATFRALGIAKDEIFVLTGLAIAQRGAGAYEEARASFLRTIALTQGTIYRRAYGHALMELAYLEHQLGDPATAVEYYQRALDLFRSRQAYNELADPLLALASAHAELGRYDEAMAALDSVRVVAIAYGFRDQAATERGARARVALAAGRPHEALRLLDEADATGDTLGVQGRVSAALTRADVLTRLRRSREAKQVLEQARRTIGARAPYDARLDLDVRLAAWALADSDAAGAAARATALAHESSRAGLRELSMSAWLVSARAARRLGDSSRAFAGLDSARAEWEALRGRPSAPEWRERRSGLARDLIVETVDLQLEAGPGTEADRTHAAFDALQHYKARTLLERALGPHAAAAAEGSLAPATLDRVQPALHPDELLLDYLVGPHLGFVFAITRDGARVTKLWEAARIEAGAALYRDLLASPRSEVTPGAEWTRSLAARQMGGDLLSPAFGELVHARHVLVSPDGALHLVPFATLEVVDSEYGPWLLAEHASVTTVPSASLLVALRSAPARNRGGSMLAVADSLPGANAEARAIGGDVLNARFVSIAGGRALAAGDLIASGAIHFAGHSQADDQSPWRSPVPFLALSGGRTATAADLAALRLEAKLAVLSSCETVDGRVLTGEGVVGLSSAFLAAGVPTVVASLWRVDDRATRRLMAAFYQALLWGAEPAAALRTAQRAVRNQPGTRHPFYWAGFVVIGDGAAAPGLLPNPFSPRTLTGYAAGGLTLAATAALAQRFRRRKTTRPRV